MRSALRSVIRARLAAEEEWLAAIDSAVVLAERNGIPTVYVVED